MLVIVDQFYCKINILINQLYIYSWLIQTDTYNYCWTLLVAGGGALTLLAGALIKDDAE